MSRIAALLFRKFVVESVLPQISSDGLYLLFTILVSHLVLICLGEPPEGRHLSTWPKRLRILQPNRNPFLAKFYANIFEVRSNLLLILHQILRLQVHLIDSGGKQAVGYSQSVGMRQQPLRFRIIFHLSRTLGICPDLLFICG